MLAARHLAAAGGRLFSAASSASASARGGHAGGAAGSGDTLGKRLLKLIYPKRSAVVVLRRWAEEGRTVQKYELNRVVRELRKYGRFKHALEVTYDAQPFHRRRFGSSPARHLLDVLPA
jgi:hypothetical protein